MRILSSLCLVLLSTTALTAQGGIGLFARAGTGGFGAGVAYGVNRTLNVRAEASYFTYSVDDLDAGLDVGYDASVDAESTLLLGSLLADWHPSGGGFRLTAGLVYNGSEASGTVVPLEPIQIGSQSYSPSQVGSITADLSPGLTIAPYAGIGFGNTVARGFGLLLDIGAIYMGSPGVDLAATGMLTPTSQEGAQIEQNLEWAQWHPIASIGVSFRLR